MNPLQSLPDYERFVYSLPQQYLSLQRSTLVVVRRGATIAVLHGENEPTLAGTDPHHKHVPPDIKHHRVPAPGMSFDKPNLPFLLAELEHLLTTD